MPPSTRSASSSGPRAQPLPMAAVQRHLALAARPLPRGPREALQQACPALTARELDVCERRLRGWTHDGIAADLGLSLVTVKTCRARAFERLELHFRSERFGEAAGFKVEPIHYRATGAPVTAFVSTALGAAQVEGGKRRTLATTAPVRSSLLPDVPTFAEAGFPKVDVSAWFVVFALAGTPAAALDRLNRQLVAAVQSPDTRAKLQETGFRVLGSSRAETDRMLAAEAARWAAVVKAAGCKGD